MYSLQLDDVFDTFFDAYFIARQTNQSNNFSPVTALKEILPRTLKQTEARIIANRNGVIAGKDISYADIHLSAILDFVGNQRDNITMPYPNVKALDARVRAIPKIAEWIKKRPITNI